MREKPRRFSARFWFEKLVLLLVIAGLFVAAWWLWSYDDAQVADTKTTEQTATVQNTQLPLTTTQPATEPAQTEAAPEVQQEETEAPESSFPFSFDDKNTAESFPGINEDFSEFTYDFRANSQVVVSRNGVADIDTLKRDFVWEYTIDEAGALTLTSTPITFCNDVSNCGIGNGVLEIIVQPAAGSDSKVIFYVTDSGEVTEFTAVDTYKPLIESYKEQA